MVPKKPEEAYIQGTKKLEEAGLKKTLPRLLLLKALVKGQSPLSAEDLHRKISQSQPERSFDLATVYRSLQTFSQLGLIESVDFADGSLRYEWKASGQAHHHHVICTSCRKVEPLHLCGAKKEQKILEQRGYKQISHRLEFFAICPNCH